MKIFLSYGHDDNAPLVRRIRDDLVAAGHAVWIDETEIKAGHEWRRTIVDGLGDTDWVVSVLSRHSVREPGVCLDELSIALNHKAGAIATVLIESEAEVRVPLSVGHVQWLDMQDWRAHESEGAGAFEAWYRPKRDELLAILSSPATQRFAGEIRTLEERLQPVSQVAEIARLTEDFTGREWLLARLEAWRQKAGESRLLWISGGPGTGKSAFAAWLGHSNRVNVIGLNLCAYNQEDRRDAGRVIRTLAFQLAARLPDYRRLLLDRLAVRDKGGQPLPAEPAALFGFLLLEPLRLAIDGGRSLDRLLVVIDGLDETVRDGRSELAEILAGASAALPPWLAIVVTSRPEDPIRSQFGNLRPVEIRAEDPDNREDLRRYLAAWLETVPGAASDPALARRLEAAADGNFLYVRMLREAVRGGALALDDPAGFPQGLGGLYARWFADRCPSEAAYAELRPLLSVVLAAGRPVPLPWLDRILGWSRRDRARLRERVGALLAEREGGLAPFHKSLRDWLLDGESRFLVDPLDGVPPLRDALWTTFAAWIAGDRTAPLDAFARAELPAQARGETEAALRARIEACGGWDAAAPAIAAVARSREAGFAWDQALAWWTLLGGLAAAAGAADWQSYAADAMGDIARSIGRSGDALRSYRDGLAIRERLALSDPANAEWQRDLSVSFDRIGDVQVAQGDGAGALRRYRDGLAIRERLALSDPANAGWQRDLSVSFIKIGDVQVAQGDGAGALRSYRDGLAIAERLALSDPANAEWQRDLSVWFDRIGNVQVAQGDGAGALRSYRDGLAIAERLALSDPANAEWQRDLSVWFDRIGNVQVAQGDGAGALRSYRDGLAIAERLALSDPANAEWQRDLSVSYNKVGDVQVAQGDRAGALRSYRDGLAIRERLARSDPANAGWQRDLSVSFIKIGDVQVAQGDGAGALRSYRDGLAIAERLALSDPANAEWQRDLSVSYNKVGDVQVAQGDGAGALRSYRDGLAIAERLALSDPANAEWQRDLSVSYNKVGDVQVAQGDRAGALRSYRDGLAIRERLARSDPANAGWQRDLSVSFIKIGDVQVAQGDGAGALRSYRDGLAIAERLALSDPANAEWQRDLSVSYNKVGDVQVAQGDRAGALRSYRDGLAIRERLARSDPANAEWQRDLSVSFSKIGDVQVAQGDGAGALRSYRDGLAIAERLALSDPANAEWQRDLIVSLVKLSDVDPGNAAVYLTRALAIAEAMASDGRLAGRDAWMVDALRRGLAEAVRRGPAP